MKNRTDEKDRFMAQRAEEITKLKRIRLKSLNLAVALEVIYKPENNNHYKSLTNLIALGQYVEIVIKVREQEDFTTGKYIDRRFTKDIKRMFNTVNKARITLIRLKNEYDVESQEDDTVPYEVDLITKPGSLMGLADDCLGIGSLLIEMIEFREALVF